MFRPDTDPLLPNWRDLPVGYHGRAGSVVVSRHAGPPPVRPAPAASGGARRFGPEPAARHRARARLRHRPGNALGTRDRHRRGARATSSASCSSTTGARATSSAGSTSRSARSWASRSPPRSRRGSCRWRRSSRPRRRRRRRTPSRSTTCAPTSDWALDIALEVELNGTDRLRTNARGLYWTVPQQLAHATVNGAHRAPRRPLRVRARSRARARQYGQPDRAHAGAGATRCSSPTGAPAPSSRTATPSSCAAAPASVSLGEVRGTIQPA